MWLYGNKITHHNIIITVESTKTLTICEDTTILKLKSLIREKIGLPDVFNIYFNGKSLRDGLCVRDYNISKLSTVKVQEVILYGGARNKKQKLQVKNIEEIKSEETKVAKALKKRTQYLASKAFNGINLIFIIKNASSLITYFLIDALLEETRLNKLADLNRLATEALMDQQLNRDNQRAIASAKKKEYRHNLAGDCL